MHGRHDRSKLRRTVYCRELAVPDAGTESWRSPPSPGRFNTSPPTDGLAGSVPHSPRSQINSAAIVGIGDTPGMEPLPPRNHRQKRIHSVWIVVTVVVAVMAGAVAPETDRVIAVLTALLAMTTAFYAVRTAATVEEMRKARLDAEFARRAEIRPRLRPVIMPGVTDFEDLQVGITNAGRGHAFDVDLEICVEPPRRVFPIDSSKGHSHENPGPRKWAWGFVDAGSTWIVREPILTPGGHPPRVRDLERTFTHLWLGGTCRDVEGRMIEVDERLELHHADHHSFHVRPYLPREDA